MRTCLATFLVLAALLLSSGDVAGEARDRFAVTYVSAENVYLDGGLEDGLHVGDRLTVSVSGKEATLEVVFAAGHSASCRLVAGTTFPSVGAKARIVARAVAVETDSSVEENPLIASQKIELARPAAAPEPALPRLVSGTVSLRHHHWMDNSPANLDFSQSDARLDLKARRLFDENITLTVRSRGRYDARVRRYSGVGRDDWENRLWELSISYDNPDGAIAVSAGRILPRNVGAVGYLDGLLVEWHVRPSMHIGVLGGRRPDWLYRTENTALTRFGVYISHRSDTRARFRINQSLVAIAEVHGGTTSRTFLINQGSISAENRIGINHTLEIDLNSGWREQRAGQSVSLSRAFVNVYWQAVRGLRLGLSYDNLRRYWTYEYRSLADSLFDDRARQGVRGRVDWQVTSRWRLGLSGGWRNRPDEEDPTMTYSLNIRRSALFHRNISASILSGGFDGPHEAGQNYAAWLYLLLPVGQTRLGYNRYQYHVQSIDTNRASWSIETGLDLNLSAHYLAGVGVNYSDGDDISGWRVQSELGYRF